MSAAKLINLKQLCKLNDICFSFFLAFQVTIKRHQPVILLSLPFLPSLYPWSWISILSNLVDSSEENWLCIEGYLPFNVKMSPANNGRGKVSGSIWIISFSSKKKGIWFKLGILSRNLFQCIWNINQNIRNTMKIALFSSFMLDFFIIYK